MEWIKKHLEKVLLGVIALGLLGSAVFLYLDSQAFLEVFTHHNASQPKDNTPPILPKDQITQSIANAKTPSVWSSHEGFLFSSQPYVLRGEQLIPLLDGTQMLFPPIPNAWIIKYNLDYSDKNLLNTDSDNDGFSVLEEFTAQTDPTDVKSMPPFRTKLRLTQYIRIPFRLKFNGTPDDGQTFTINTIDRRGPTQFLKLGEKIEGTPFVLLSYRTNKFEKEGIPIDESELTIENTENKEKVILINGKVVDSPTSKAKLIYLLDNSEFEVKKGDTFALPSENNVHYKLIDVNDNQAVIQNTQTGDNHTVPLLQPH
ncbi:MAG: Amuc_1099 family pilus-like system protein [Chthoniobacterales bacterium]